ncbi:hypothetical protein KC131_18790 [Pseudomonas sp. JQ170]|uniref:head-tail joining protein n=1 Tax=unclassified Pseudomonas TaxID=196821 RepID=UPI00265521F7|nr:MULTISPECIES: hypothetical protein [unclassified Pseudomonas]MDN7142699.1 hypothetical protein [Pseudomonas sp. JQ170]WRO77949.1 hypothetical protein U9R80_09855 [Pseudomonas sp. 170C]
MTFRSQVAAMDTQLLEVLGDEALIEGRSEPVPGFISVPWLQPKFGQIKTAIREPTFAVRIADAVGIASGQSLSIDLPPEDGGGKYVIVKLEPDGTGWVNLVLREVR